MKKPILSLILSALIISVSAQRKIENAAEILHEIQKLKVVGNVLYLAAHPDDENTRLIAWLENEAKVRTAYLSLTRGDGGQNLIGTEKGDALGVLRTQELLEARKEDGAEQFFTRAKDFGYSKTSKETFEKWNKEKVLEEVVWVIRSFQPDVIITRFPPDERAGHGHHTASAMLAEEAFELAADPKYAPDQLSKVKAWKTNRILWNTSVWWDRQLPEKAAKADDYVKIDIGAYNSLLGLSYSEIAADSRSQHKSQGFGSARARGTKLEYLKHTAGEKAESDLFEGIDLSWSRIDDKGEIEKKIDQIINEFNFDQPSKSVKALAQLHEMISSLEESPYKIQKLKDVEALMLKCSGIYIEVLADEYLISSEKVKCNAEIIKRSDANVKLKGIALSKKEYDIKDSLLPFNELVSIPLNLKTNFYNNPDHPYWLSPNYLRNGFIVSENTSHYPINPENDKLHLLIRLEIEGRIIEHLQQLDYKWTDRAKGELHRDVFGTPELTLTSLEESQLFNTPKPRTISLIAEAHKDDIEGVIKINVPLNWTANPAQLEYKMEKKGEKQKLEFQLSPSMESSRGKVSFTVKEQSAKAIQRIEYDHIRPQFMFPKSEIKVARFVLNGTDQKIAYIEGSGDLVDESLRGVGYEVENFTADDILTADLSEFQTVIVGIRAYNTDENMQSANAILNDFAENGGTVIVQYNTSRGLKSDQIGPYQLVLSRKRVTDEKAAPTLLNKEHPIFNRPNTLNEKDFKYWVQERGLYFAGEWGEEYDALISWNDEGEEGQKGGLLVANYGSGKLIYTGISFFRQLPAGVPGAYRLLANLIAYGQVNQ